MRITARAKRVTLQECRRNPYLGVRGLAALLLKKYGIRLSKSSIHSILRKKGERFSKGRKESALQYSRKSVQDCGLFLLRCLDDDIGLTWALTDGLAARFPSIKKAQLRKLILLMLFSSYEGGSLHRNAFRRGFLRLADLYAFPSQTVRLFLDELRRNAPSVDLSGIKDNAQEVIILKFSFENGGKAYTDARCTTLWDEGAGNRSFSSCAGTVKRVVADMLKEAFCMVQFTTSSPTIHRAALDFINGLQSGVHAIDLVGAG
jgi:hypothetical protein